SQSASLHVGSEPSRRGSFSKGIGPSGLPLTLVLSGPTCFGTETLPFGTLALPLGTSALPFGTWNVPKHMASGEDGLAYRAPRSVRSEMRARDRGESGERSSCASPNGRCARRRGG